MKKTGLKLELLEHVAAFFEATVFQENRISCVNSAVTVR